MLVDDMTVADLAHMPKVRGLLGARGVTFSHAISPNPVCCPARAGLITGQYTHNNGVYSNSGYYGGLNALRQPNNTLPVWLQRAGYNTAFFGKYLNGYGDARKNAVPLGWDWWDATGWGTYAYTQFQFANNGKPKMFRDDYITTRLRQRSDSMIHRFSQARRKTGEPFFIFDSYVAPHYAISKGEVRAGPVPEPKYEAWTPPIHNPAEAKPSFNRAIRHWPVRGTMAKARYRDPLEMQEIFLDRIRSLASVDDAVAQTVRTLKQEKQYQNTVFIFLSDNGMLLGEHGKFGKQSPFTESVTVPLIIAGPGFSGGQVSARWATVQDVATTVLDLAQARPGRPLDGRTLRGASSLDPAPTAAVLIENGNNEATGPESAPWHYRGVLLGSRYTYTKWATNGRGEELYDNKLDPFQLTNLVPDPRYRPILLEARRQLALLRDCGGVGSCYGQAPVLEPLGGGLGSTGPLTE